MRRVITIAGLLLILVLTGTVGFRVVTGTPWIECFYLAVITLTTVGYREPKPLDHFGMVFVVVYLVAGLGIFTYSAFLLGQMVVEAQMRELWEKRRMEQAINKLSNHFIVCGMGRMGRTICQYLHNRNKPFVVIDVNDDKLQAACKEHNWLNIVGDATSDAVLQRAGAERALSLTTVLATDADNLYVVLSARMLNSKLQIIARASDEKAVEKMQHAGATRVVSPYNSGAIKMARFMLHPSIEDFLEIADSQGSDLEIADIQIAADSPYVGKQLMETDFRGKGVMVIGIHRANGDRLMPPPGTAVIEAGDSLFAFGSADSVNQVLGETDTAG